MKKLTREQFQERLNAICRARKIFIGSGITNNISVAFEIYQALLAEQERALTLTKELADGRIGTLFDEYERPECPDCGTPMLLRAVLGEPDYNSQIVCPNQKCATAFLSEKTIDDWKKELKKREV